MGIKSSTPQLPAGRRLCPTYIWGSSHQHHSSHAVGRRLCPPYGDQVINTTAPIGNPYRNVYRVLKFAAKHGKPLGHRSVLTYSDDVRPSRIDYAKQKYGGIFTTEVVEDVKTFLRILIILLAITPMFCFEVSTSYLFPIYGWSQDFERGGGLRFHIDASCMYIALYVT